MKMRTERLKELIREVSAEVILHELTDPRIGFCTVTRVELVDDLSHCTVFVSVLGGQGDKSKTMHGLADARGLIQRAIAKQMKTRTTPHVKLELDETIEKSFEIFERIKEARASDPDGGKSTAAEKTENVEEVDSDEASKKRLKLFR